jgi:hypothetical protein
MKKNVVIMLVILLIAALAVSCASSGGGGKTSAKGVKYKWDFSDAGAGTAGWFMVPDEYWDFHGTAVLSRDDKTFGKPMLRMDVDFTNDTKSEWSEPKMKMQFKKPVEGVSKITFDFIYNPAFSKSGCIKSKVITFNGKKQLAQTHIDDIFAFDELPNGYVKGEVMLIAASSTPVDNMLLSIAGYLSDYKGPVFFDNMRLE